MLPQEGASVVRSPCPEGARAIAATAAWATPGDDSLARTPIEADEGGGARRATDGPAHPARQSATTLRQGNTVRRGCTIATSSTNGAIPAAGPPRCASARAAVDRCVGPGVGRRV